MKLLACKSGTEELPGCHLLVTAAAYEHRLTRLGKPGLDLLTFPEPRQSPLADHKSLNYLYYRLAGAWAAARSGDEALILNPDGTVSETNTASLLVLSGKAVLSPVSQHVLPGVTAGQCRSILAGLGYTLTSEAFGPERLHRSDQVLLASSLMGAVPARSLDGRQLPAAAAGLIDEINRHLFPAAGLLSS